MAGTPPFHTPRGDMAVNSSGSNSPLLPEAARARYGDALRRGHSEWLWPDIDPKGWQAALCAIERVTRDILGGGSAPLLAGDPQELGIAAFTSGMGPLLGYWASQDMLQVDAPIRSVLALHY